MHRTKSPQRIIGTIGFCKSFRYVDAYQLKFTIHFCPNVNFTHVNQIHQLSIYIQNDDQMLKRISIVFFFSFYCTTRTRFAPISFAHFCIPIKKISLFTLKLHQNSFQCTNITNTGLSGHKMHIRSNANFEKKKTK